MTGNLALVTEDSTDYDQVPKACCDACQDTNAKIRALHELATNVYEQMQSGGGPMGMIFKMMGR